MAELVIPAAQRDAHERGLRQFRESGDSGILERLLEQVAVRRDGGEFPVEVTIVPVVIGGEQQFSSFVRDITESKHLQAQLLHAQKMERYWIISR